MKPHGFIAFLVVPMYTLLYLWGPPPNYGRDYFELPYFLLGLAFLCALMIAAYVASRAAPPPRALHGPYMTPLFLDVLAIVTFLAYGIWFWRLALEPQLIADVVFGRLLYVRGEISTTPGLTTLSQLGVVYGILFALIRWRTHQRVARRHSVFMGLIVVLTLFRTVVWAERLGTLELIVPMLLIYSLGLQPRSRTQRVLIAVAPILAILAVILFFGATEAMRSWFRHREGTESLFAYMWNRFTYYYWSSFNNGSGLLQEYPWPQWDMRFTLQWIYALPGLGKWLAGQAGVGNQASMFLTSFGDSEFTTFSGIFSIFYDIGTGPALLFACVLGAVIGIAYRQFRSGTGIGVLMFPVLYVHLLEIPRLHYLGNQRVVPIFLFLGMAYAIYNRNRAKIEGLPQE